MLDRLQRGEVITYPPIIQHALAEMRLVLKRYLKQAGAAELERREALAGLLEVASIERRETTTNLRAVAEWWLEVVQPYRLEALAARRKRKPLRRRLLGSLGPTASLRLTSRCRRSSQIRTRRLPSNVQA